MELIDFPKHLNEKSRRQELANYPEVEEKLVRDSGEAYGILQMMSGEQRKTVLMNLLVSALSSLGLPLLWGYSEKEVENALEEIVMNFAA